MSFKLALVQPLSHRPPGDAENVTDAVRFVEQAAALGAQVVTFPESYPGPWRMPATFDAHERLGDAARRCGVYVQYGTLEPIDDDARTAHNLLVLAGPRRVTRCGRSAGTGGRARCERPLGGARQHRSSGRSP